MINKVLTLISLVVVVGCSQEEAAAPEAPIRPVKSIVVQPGDISQRQTFSGSAKADTEADISFKVSGTLLNRPVDIGDRVTRGDLLAELDRRDFEIQVREADAQLANAKAALRNAEANYDRVRDLYENDNVARSELDNARASAESAEAQVKIAEQSLANNRLQLSYTRVVAPGDCDIAETFFKENENVGSGQAIVRLNCGSCAEVRLSVSESHIGHIQVNDDAEVSFSALGDQTFAAQVTEVGVAIASEANAFPVLVKLNEGCDQVRPGMVADVAFRFDVVGSADGILIPVVAVGEDRSGRYVYVLDQQDETFWRAVRRPVTIGPPQQGGIVITGGLESGERVVTAGVRRITDGQVVRLFGS